MTATEGPTPLIAGRYRVGARLGSGGMAEVLDAFDERLERAVAVKVLRPEVAADADMRRRFEAEARAAARFTHPSVVSVYDSGEHGGRAFLVMERLPGETLADRIRQGPVDQVWLRTVAFDVLAALGAAHDIGLLHRDIKPGNVLITTENRAKVADFGIAKMMADQGGPEGDLTAVGLVVGTPAYLAPERLAGQPATVSTDLFALGVVLYEAANGHKPPPGALDATVVGTGAAGVAEAVPAIDPALARVIRRSMAPRPEDRYPSAAAMATDLEWVAPVEVPPTIVAAPTVLAEERVLPVAPFPPRGLVAEPADHRRALGIAAALLLIIIAIVIILILAANTKGGNPPSTTTVPTTTAPTTATTSPPTTAPPRTSPPTTAAPTTAAPTTPATTVPASTTTAKATTTTAKSTTTTTTTIAPPGT
ncbi:MAG: serine/threonine protein kinase [Actinomycetota bacterium]|nr:serine/threonine protein kinase [Actinomycetota bacterium]